MIAAFVHHKEEVFRLVCRKMMRMFGVLTAEYFDMTEVFRGIADAEAWLATVAT